MTDRCINLDTHEAKAAAEGRLRVIFRPVALVDFRPSDNELFCWMYRDRQIRRRFNRQMWNYIGPDEIKCPLGSPGDVLVGREKWARLWTDGAGFSEEYFASSPYLPRDWLDGGKWRSAATMPAHLARHRWRIKSVDVVRLGSLSPRDLPTDDCIGWGATKRTWPKETPSESGEGWSMGWLRVGQLSQYAGGIYPRNDKRPLRERHVCLGTPQAAVGNYWHSRFGKKHPWETSWAWRIEVENG